jgi:hypothetical protein
MDRPMPIIVDLIATITGLPRDGENPEQYLEDKTRTKAISDEIKAKYGTKRGNMGIRINDINDPMTRLATRLLKCKLMCKCHKEEVPTGVDVVVVQCAKGSSMSWAPYLLNSFLEDCKDTQDWGSEFPLLVVTHPHWSHWLEGTSLQEVPGETKEMWHNILRLIMQQRIPQEKEYKHRHLCEVFRRNAEPYCGYMAHFIRDCSEVWTGCEIQGNAP